MNRVSQTRNKLTWFGAIVIAIALILSVWLKLEQIAVTAIGGLTFVIGGYQASQGYTKAKFIQHNPTNKEES